jgi:hypothetical protein
MESGMKSFTTTPNYPPNHDNLHMEMFTIYTSRLRYRKDAWYTYIDCVTTCRMNQYVHVQNGNWGINAVGWYQV